MNQKEKNPIESILKDFKSLVLDGAFASELERKGCDLNDKLWSAKVLMEQPELVLQVHEDYYRAGADLAITASYQATIQGFMERGLNYDQAKALIAKSIELAKEARDKVWAQVDDKSSRPKPLVAASVGPYGAYLADGSEYRGDYGKSLEELIDFHKERMEILIDAKPDILACETIPCLLEAKAILSILKEHPHMSAWISFSAKDESHINSGESIVECVKWLDTKPQVAAIGVNCTSPEYIKGLVKAIKSVSNKPIIIYPNSGEDYDATTKEWHGCTRSTINEVTLNEWFDAGARIIGGCCRTSPKDIKVIADWTRK